MIGTFITTMLQTAVTAITVCLMYAQSQSSIILKSLYSEDYSPFTHPKCIRIVPQSINEDIQIQDPIKVKCIYSNTIWIQDEMKSVHLCANSQQEILR